MPKIHTRIVTYETRECTKEEVAEYIREARLYVDPKNNIYVIDVFGKDINSYGYLQKLFVLKIDRQLYCIFKEPYNEDLLMEYVKSNIPCDFEIIVG